MRVFKRPALLTAMSGSANVAVDPDEEASVFLLSTAI